MQAPKVFWFGIGASCGAASGPKCLDLCEEEPLLRKQDNFPKPLTLNLGSFPLTVTVTSMGS